MSAENQTPSAFLLVCSTGHPVAAIRDALGRCVGRPPDVTEDASAVVLFRPLNHQSAGFLFRADDATRTISIGHDPDVHPVLSFSCERRNRDQVALRSPTSDFYICSVPSSISSDADLCCNRPEANDWETFRLLPVDLRKLPPTTIRLMQAIDAAFTPVVTASSILGWLIETPSALLDLCGVAVLRTLSPADLRVLAGLLLEDEDLFRKVRGCLSNDLWLRRLVELRHWNVDRSPLSHLALDESWDRCAVEFGWTRNVPFGEILLGLMREHVVPRRSLCVMTTARSEGLYLLEWIAHHRALGVEHFFVYSNQNDDGSDRLLDELARLGQITWVTNTMRHGVNPQTRAYTHCFSHLTQPLDFKWTVLIDLDEFVTLNPERYLSLPEFLDHQDRRGADAVSMHWSMMTPGGESRWSPEPMMRRFTHREPEPNRHVKSAFITARHVSSHPHNPVPAYKRAHVFLNAAGTPHHLHGSASDAHEGEPNFDDAWISHYFYKSLDEWIWKMSRGFDAREELVFEPRALEVYFKFFEAADSEPDRRALHHLDALDAELEKLRSIPALAQAEAASRKMFVERVAAMKMRVITRITRVRMLPKGGRAKVIALLHGGQQTKAS